MKTSPTTSPSCSVTFAMPWRSVACRSRRDHLVRLVGPLWREWLTAIDHKKIGVMYVDPRHRHAAARLRRRGHDDCAEGGRGRRVEGYLPPHHYDQIFTAHGVIMIFFVAMPFVTGLMNYVVPLQIGARDVAFPFLNNFSFWMTARGAVSIMPRSSSANSAGPAGSPIRHSRERPQPGVRRRLLHLGAADRGRRHHALRHQPDRDDREDARAGHDHDEAARLRWTSLCTNVRSRRSSRS